MMDWRKDSVNAEGKKEVSLRCLCHTHTYTVQVCKDIVSPSRAYFMSWAKSIHMTSALTLPTLSSWGNLEEQRSKTVKILVTLQVMGVTAAPFPSSVTGIWRIFGNVVKCYPLNLSWSSGWLLLLCLCFHWAQTSYDWGFIQDII